MPHELRHADYLISDDPARIDPVVVHAYLSRSYWAEGIPLETVTRALANSLCLGIYAATGEQVGLVRVITDSATFAYLCDVYVLEPHRRRGLSKAALQLLATHPQLQNLRRQHLVTQDAHGLYAQFGFKPIEHPQLHMEKRNAYAYKPSRSIDSRLHADGPE
jgi:N-acetylglutamate synthase-like GNAT family acetyltransferase